MKNTLKILLILLPFFSYSQRNASASVQIETAKEYFAKEPCSKTGILWLKSALKQEPNNAEAKKLLKDCASPSKTAIDYNNDAKKHSENRMYNLCVESSNKAIALDSTNASYYFVRSKCLAYTDDYKSAINDIDKVLMLTTPTGKIYMRKAGILRANALHVKQQAKYYHPKKSEDNFSDNKKDDTKEKLLKQVDELYAEALKNYELAKTVNSDIDIDYKELIKRIKSFY